MMMQPDELFVVRRVLDGILHFVANVFFNILIDVVLEGFFYLIGLCIELVLDFLFNLSF